MSTMHEHYLKFDQENRIIRNGDQNLAFSFKLMSFQFWKFTLEYLLPSLKFAQKFQK